MSFVIFGMAVRYKAELVKDFTEIDLDGSTLVFCLTG